MTPTLEVLVRSFFNDAYLMGLDEDYTSASLAQHDERIARFLEELRPFLLWSH